MLLPIQYSNQRIAELHDENFWIYSKSYYMSKPKQQKEKKWKFVFYPPVVIPLSNSPSQTNPPGNNTSKTKNLFLSTFHQQPLPQHKFSQNFQALAKMLPEWQQTFFQNFQALVQMLSFWQNFSNAWKFWKILKKIFVANLTTLCKHLEKFWKIWKKHFCCHSGNILTSVWKFGKIWKKYFVILAPVWRAFENFGKIWVGERGLLTRGFFLPGRDFLFGGGVQREFPGKIV